MQKKQIENQLASFFISAMGDAFMSVSISDEDFEILKEHPDTLGIHGENDASLEYGTITLTIELTNGKAFTLTASEWAQITKI